MIEFQSSVPVLLIMFNRPQLTQRVFQRIREARPERLFVAADGPRAECPDDVRLCTETRDVVAEVDWACEVQTLLRENNLGCRRAVSSAISWFLAHAGQGIILEDDCLPSPDLFPFCTQLLERYRDDPRVMMISGDNVAPLRDDRTALSYRFSHYAHIWGWATWKRAWDLYDEELRDWPELRKTRWLQSIVRSHSGVRFWREAFDAVYNAAIDTWDYQWQYSCWRANGLSITPSANLVSNIGFGGNATHTTQEGPLAGIQTSPLTFPLRHPNGVRPDAGVDKALEARMFPQPDLRLRALRSLRLRWAAVRGHWQSRSRVQ